MATTDVVTVARGGREFYASSETIRNPADGESWPIEEKRYAPIQVVTKVTSKYSYIHSAVKISRQILSINFFLTMHKTLA